MPGSSDPEFLLYEWKGLFLSVVEKSRGELLGFMNRKVTHRGWNLALSFGDFAVVPGRHCKSDDTATIVRQERC